jgi:proteic killer suppression protein
MIVSFADQGTEDIFHGVDSKAARKTLAKALWGIARRKLDMLNAATTIADLLRPPANRLERLQGDLKGFYSIRVNDQFRVVFKFAEGNVSDVKITDYH